ncbi:MAG: heavy metal translocating P-type ATPase [Fervidicoccaceae archaeon]
MESLLRKINKVPGVINSEGSSITNNVRILLNPLEISKEQLFSELKKLGLEFSEVSETSIKEKRERTLLIRRLSAFIVGTGTLTYSMLGSFFHTWSVNVYGLLILSLIVLSLSYDIIKRGFKTLISGAPGMDSLIALSSSLSFIFGIIFSFNSFTLSKVNINVDAASFFEASAGVLGFVGIGKYLEERLRVRAIKYLSQLESVLSMKARIVEDRRVLEVTAGEVRPNDIVEIKAGDKIPVDGIVIEGSGYVDESTFTGEPNPVYKSEKNRDQVLAGTILVSGYFKVRATRVGKDTSIYHIAESAREAQLHKPEFQKIADRIVGLLTWVVIIIALFALSIWYFYTGNIALSVMFAASILAVTCPCPLGIAIPLVVSLGVLNSAKNGIVVRKGDAFERITSATVAIFDKTGTITRGEPEIVRYIRIGKEDFLEHACVLETRSEHVLAKAMIRFCENSKTKRELQISSYESFPGLGVIGEVSGNFIAIGNIELMRRLEVLVSEEAKNIIEGIGKDGGTPIMLAANGKLVGIMEVRDEIRSEVKEVVDFLKKKGLKIAIASGDLESNVRRTAEIIGADFYYSDLRPEDKGDIIKELQEKGEKVVFIGDGVNDAIALGSAFLGIAVGRATDIAKEAGDVVLTSEGLKGLVRFYDMSERVMKGAKQNLAWAFSYNFILIPIAGGALFPAFGFVLKPELSALAMILSDITVILNSIRIISI